MTEPDPLEEIAGAILDGTPLDWGEISASMAQQDAQLLRELQILATVKHVASGPPAAAGSLVQWGPLRVLDCVGQGAFGEVYRAWDTRL
ncbi:MAG TPA: hypothetical protein VEP28_11030, partial [Rubrobacter sp.]|nr:hypothetical protein [Rubrobacter sp.]